MKSIGLIGRKQSGKDTVATTLVDHCGYTRVAFGDALKDLTLKTNPRVSAGIHRLLTEVVHEVGWDTAKETWPDVRRVLQRLGVAARDVIGPDVWINAVRERLAVTAGPVVVTDVRFANEAEFLHSQGFELVRLTRPGLSTTDPHVSEVGSDELRADWLITNDSTRDALDRHVRHFAKVVLHAHVHP